MRQRGIVAKRARTAIETPGADYPPSEDFTEDLENEDIPPEKLPGQGRAGRRSRARTGWEDIEEEYPGKTPRGHRSRPGGR